jgi:hypothetical protein
MAKQADFETFSHSVLKQSDYSGPTTSAMHHGRHISIDQMSAKELENLVSKKACGMCQIFTQSPKLSEYPWASVMKTFSRTRRDPCRSMLRGLIPELHSSEKSAALPPVGKVCATTMVRSMSDEDSGIVSAVSSSTNALLDIAILKESISATTPFRFCCFELKQRKIIVRPNEVKHFGG